MNFLSCLKRYLRTRLTMCVVILMSYEKFLASTNKLVIVILPKHPT